MQARLESIEYCKLLTSTTRAIYEKIASIHCPILKEKVIFNAKGFHHLLYESNGKARSINERIYKLTLMPLAKAVIQNATSIDEERNVKIRVSRKKKTLLKDGKTFSLVASVGRKNPVQVRVILLRIGNGNLTFRSIMKH